jgi:hypothetical protein
VKTVDGVMAVVVLAAFFFSRPMGAPASPSMDQRGKENGMEFQKGYAPVDGLSMYYEIHGSTHADRLPLVLIHGGGSRTAWLVPMIDEFLDAPLPPSR